MADIKINENITLKYIPMHKLKTTTVDFYLHRRLDEEEASYNALLPYVLKRGCALCPDSEAMEKYLENLYGADLRCTVSKKGDDQVITFDMETISSIYAANKEPLLEDMITLLMSVVFDPVVENGGFKEEFVAQEKKNAVERIESVINEKRTYAMLRCIEEMCKGERFAVSRLGTVEKTEKITPETLYEHYKNIITSSVIDIYICGDCDADKIAGLIKDSISGIPFEQASRPQMEAFKGGDDVKHVTEKLDVVQGKMSLGFTVDTTSKDEDYYAMCVANAIFGAGTQSKLFCNVREKLSLAYYASSQLLQFKGLMIVNAGIEFDKFQEAYDETMAQLKALQEGDVSQMEYDAAIKILVNSRQSILDDQRQLADFYMSHTLIESNETVEESIEKIKNVTLEQAVEAAKKIRLNTVYFLTGKEA